MVYGNLNTNWILEPCSQFTFYWEMCRTLFSLVTIQAMALKAMKCRNSWHSISQFLVLIVLRAGVQRSLEPVQLLQLSAKCGEWWKMLLHYILHSLQQLQSPTRDHFMVSSETRSLVASYDCQNTMMLHTAPQLIVWADKTLTFNVQFYERRASTDQGTCSSPALQPAMGGINIVDMRRVSRYLLHGN